jgi:apolipoprotein N-acyltransferase
MLTLFTRARESMRHSKLEHPAVKYLLFPLLLALPAFRLHQHIAYGSSFGEYYSFGLKAYLTTLCLWWATWAIGVATSAALLRMGMESMSLIATLLRPQQASDSRYLIERIGQIALYLGMPLWLVWRMTGSN